MTATKGAADPLAFHRPAFFYGSAREGFRDLLENLAHVGADSVLLPAFIGWSAREGSGVFDPVDALGLTPTFYPVNRDLTVDLSGLADCLAAGRHRALVLIHYYGRTDPATADIRRLADEHGVFLVEDLAHGFFSSTGGGMAGRVGDASLFSLHKMLPLQDGGMVHYRSARHVLRQQSTRPELSERLLSFDWPAISNVRRRNFEQLTRLLAAEARDDVELVWPTLDLDDVPQSLPLFLTDDCRDQVYEAMNARGYGVVSLYHTLVPGLVGAFATSDWAAAHILNLPVHQDVGEDSLVPMIQALVNCLDELT